MRSSAAWSLAMLAALGASSCAERHTGVTDCANFVLSPTEFHIGFTGRAGMTTQQEFTFICHAAVLGRADVTFASMAQRQAADRAVVAFAANVIATQQDLDRRLTGIAEQQEGVTPPRALDAPRLAMRDQLARLSGGAFDRAYLQNQVQNGAEAIALFKEEIASGNEPILRSFALDALPVLEERMRQAQQLIAQLTS